jgi:hypothetical protein
MALLVKVAERAVQRTAWGVRSGQASRRRGATPDSEVARARPAPQGAWCVVPVVSEYPAAWLEEAR